MASPLFKHRNGQWATKKGKLYYFGTDREDALRRWLDEKDYLLAGLTPPKDEDALQVRDILNGFHRLKKQANERGRSRIGRSTNMRRSATLLPAPLGNILPSN